AMFEDLPLDELRGLIDRKRYYNLLVAISRCPPIREPLPEHFDDFLRHHAVKIGAMTPRPIFDPKVLPLIDRATAERYIPLFLARDLAYRQELLPMPVAQRAARLFLAPFGPGSWFYPN